MGNQGHATEGARLTNEWIQAGIIGTVREVHVWSDRAGRLWKQGIGRPTDRPPVPSTLDWNLWLGPIRERPYSPAYAPVSWRGWWDFGTGAMGDMGCHIIDHPVWALRLGPPSFVESRTTIDGSFLDGDKPNTETYPIAAMIYYEFPARGDLPPVRMTWYDGGLMPPAPAELPAGERLARQWRPLYRQQGKDVPRLSRRYAAALAALASTTKPPRSTRQSSDRPATTKNGSPPAKEVRARSPISITPDPLTEIMLLGVLALKAPGRRLEWDSENLKIKNAPELNHLVHAEYRKGWTLSHPASPRSATSS